MIKNHRNQPLWQRAMIIAVEPHHLIGRLIWVKTANPIVVNGFNPHTKELKANHALESNIIYDLDDAVIKNTLLCFEPKGLELRAEFKNSVELEKFSEWNQADG